MAINFSRSLPFAGTRITAANFGSAFTYQGHLTQGGEAANGAFDFRFSLYAAASAWAGLIEVPAGSIYLPLLTTPD